MWLDVALTSFFSIFNSIPPTPQVFFISYGGPYRSNKYICRKHSQKTECTHRNENTSRNRKYSQKTYTFQERTEISYPAFGESLTLFYYCFEHFYTFYQTFYSAKGRAAAPSAPLNLPLLSETNTLSENTIHFHKTNSTLSRNGIHSKRLPHLKNVYTSLLHFFKCCFVLFGCFF